MAGSDGNRGYLVQTLIALFDSLRSETWKRITIEPAHESDKVDVLWDEAKTRKAVQVKSSINQIGMRDVERWATELEAGSSADELKLVLVGPCSGTVAKLRTVGRVLVPCPKNLDFDGFLAEAAHLLDRFLFSVGLECESPDQRELLIRGMTTELSRLSSEALSLDRSAFVSMLV